MASNQSTLTRRRLILGMGGAPWAAAATRNDIYNPELAVHTSLWAREAEFRRQSLSEIGEEAFASIARAGYRRVELLSEFLSPELRDTSLARLKKYRLEPCIVSTAGAVHEEQAASESRKRTLEMARLMQGRGIRYINFTAAAPPDGQTKTQGELVTQAYQLNRMGQELREAGAGLLLHPGPADMRDHAREWRFTVAHTEAGLVSFCIDVATAVRAGVAPRELIEEAGPRMRSLHLRNPRRGVEQEKLADGDIDLVEIAAVLRRATYDGLLVVELLYGQDTPRQRSLAADLSLSRWYMQEVFGSRPGNPPVNMGPHVRVRL